MWIVTSMYGTQVGTFATRAQARDAACIHLNRTGTPCDVAKVAATANPRYFVTEVSVGDAGLTARPAVCDRVNSENPRHARIVKVFRSNEVSAAKTLAAELNSLVARIDEGLNNSQPPSGFETNDKTLKAYRKWLTSLTDPEFENERYTVTREWETIGMDVHEAADKAIACEDEAMLRSRTQVAATREP